MQKFRISGQHLSELVLCLAMVSTTILVMRLYVVRTLQARYKAGPDYVFLEIKQEAARKGKAGLQNVKTQYDPYYTESLASENHTGDSTMGFPHSAVNQTFIRGSWQKVNAPGNAD